MSDNPRSCGECSACCTVLGVDDLKPPKADYEACRHCRLTGSCGIYADRPPSCASYRCGWLDGWLDDEHRPDRLGAVLEPYLAPDGGPPGYMVRLVTITHAVIAFVDWARQETVVIVVYDARRRGLLGPPARVEALRRIVERRT